MRFALLLIVAFVGTFLSAQPLPALKTVAEESKFAKTSTSAEVAAYCTELAKRFPKVVTHSSFAKSTKGIELPLLLLAPSTSPEKPDDPIPTVVIVANIHAGEVDAKEAVLALARDLAADDKLPIRQKLRIAIVPNFNPDGNDAMSDQNRTDQNGPKSVGLRANGGGFDLNRDFVKLESPETRTLVGLLNKFDPLMVIDGHTTNGSYHRYTLTYDGPRLPAADPKLIAYARETLLPKVGDKVKKSAGFDTFTYGDFDAKHEAWLTYGSGPRYGTQLFSLRGSFGILSESYTYSSYEDRIKASYAFIKGNLEFIAENLAEVQGVVSEAKKPREKVALRTKTDARPKPVSVKGWVEVAKDGKPTKTDEPKDYDCRILDVLVPTVEVTRPYAYLIPPEFAGAVDTLRRHGIVVKELREQIELDTETYAVTKLAKAEREFQKHKIATVEATAKPTKTKAQPGTFVVLTDQKLGQLAAYMLEPQAEDGLTTWNFFDAGLAEGQPFPVLRVPAEQPMFAGEPAPLPEDRKAARNFTIDDLGGDPKFGALGFVLPTWLDDGEHWLQRKGGKHWKVSARTGRAELFVDPAKLARSIGAIDVLPEKERKELFEALSLNYSPDRSAILFETSRGHILAFRDGSPAKHLIKKEEKDKNEIEFPEFSPDGRHLAFVHKGNLFAIDLSTLKETQFTTDGGKDEILNGRADWVYEEEIFNRNGRAYWWSPDSKSMAFLRFDDAKVPTFTLATEDGQPEAIRYPKAGQTNPLVKLAVVALTDGKPRFLDLGEQKPDDLLIARVGWTPGKDPKPYAYLQNRVQTWLDVMIWSKTTDKPTKLLRETTKAWVEDLGEARFLKDGSFLILSERSGWKHIYHYAAEGNLIRQLTAGEWEVKQIERIDEASGDVYFTGTKVSHTGNHLMLVTLQGDEVQVISHAKTTHRISMAPKGSLYIDVQSDDTTPSQSLLRELYVRPIRILDINPAHDRAAVRFGRTERTTIKTADGFELEAAVTYPPDFHELNRYPIWMLTYAGPHAPTVRDGWNGGRVTEQVLAAQGIVVLRVDPRSASGKGAVSAWTCYKQLGVQELKDLEDAARWIGEKSWADKNRIGLSGHSYGGYITAYALTHSKLFAAGLAGAPVTDWTFYDSIYTERYMGLPAENKEGYAKTSAVASAKDLHGKLMLVHGLIDDNVHPQNSLKLATALQKANVDFDMMVYPTHRHGIREPHYNRLVAKFAKEAFGSKDR